MGALLSCCCPDLKKMMGSIELMNGTMEGVKIITDDTQLVVKTVKGFVGDVKSKTDSLEKIICDDVKKSIDQIRGILDQVPKIPDTPELPDMGAAGMGSLFDYIPAIPGMTPAKETAPPAAQVHPELPNTPAVSSAIATNARVEGSEPSFR